MKDIFIIGLTEMLTAEGFRNKTKETKTNRKKLETANRVAKKVQQQIERFQKPSQESTQRIFQYTYAPLLTINAKSERIIHPFRYQLRPSFKEEEVPSKINMFNARCVMRHAGDHLHLVLFKK